MKKQFLNSLAITGVLTSLVIQSTQAMAATTVQASEVEARTAAIQHIVSDMKTDPNSKWLGKKIQLSRGIAVYDGQEQIMGYMYNISVDGHPQGFITIGTDESEFPVLE